MQVNKRKVKHMLRIIRTLSVLLVLVILCCEVTYSWLKREWSPYIYSGDDGITIATSGALVFKMDENMNSEGVLSKTINEILGIQGTFAMKPVSNVTGAATTFFRLNYTDDPATYSFQQLPAITMETARDNYGFIDITFYIQADNSSARYIYLHEDSHIALAEASKVNDDKYDVAHRALRVAISIDNGAAKLFSADGPERTYTAVSPVPSDKNPETYYKFYSSYDADTQSGVKNTAPIATLNDGDVGLLSDYNGYDMLEDGTRVKNTDKCLFVIGAGKTAAIHVRIWLEGEDEYCNESIVNKDLDVLIKFAAYVVTSEEGT